MTENFLIRVYVNKIAKSITLKIKTGYYMEFLTPETVRLLGSTKTKKLRRKIEETKVVHSNIFSNNSQNE